MLMARFGLVLSGCSRVIFPVHAKTAETERRTIKMRSADISRHARQVIDVTQGSGASFSLEGPEGVSFVTGSRAYSAQEWQELQDQSS